MGLVAAVAALLRIIVRRMHYFEVGVTRYVAERPRSALYSWTISHNGVQYFIVA
jgi:hypothetical protein